MIAEYLNRAKAAPQRDALYRNHSNLDIQPCYFPHHPDQAYQDKLGVPGCYPFTRGVHETMYRGKLWTMRQFAGFGTPEDTNRRFKYLLGHGQTGLSTAFDMPTLMGYDPDHPMSLGEVGKEGVSVACLKDMEALFDGLPLDRITTSMTINATAIIAISMYAAMARRRGIGLDSIGGTTQNDILKEYIAQKEWISPPRPAMRLIQDVMAYSATHLPRWNTISISGYHIREAGATAVQELAFTLADGIGYVQAGLEAGLKVDDFAPRLSFFFDVHNDFFEEIAKFRAARRIWSRVLKNRFRAQNPRSWMLRTHAQTAGVSLTAQQPHNNVVRTALQALAAVLGGTQSLHTNSLDETYALPTEDAVKIALRTQQIIAEETGVASTIDPLGGSFYVEQLTDQMEEAAMAYIRKIDDLGGIVRAIEVGFPQKEIADAAYQFQRDVELGKRVIVGVNKYREEADTPIPLLHVDAAVEQRQRERMRQLKETRDRDAAARALDRVRQACHTTDNLMPLIMDAMQADVTLGEVSDVFRAEFGIYRDPAYC
jgi:methylmalonyl-CoA mutase N-terminal domain/subunit